MFTLFTGRHVGGLKRSSKILQHVGLHTRLCNIVRNISTNISTLGQRTRLKFGELSLLFIVYNTTFFLFCPMHCFWFYLVLRDNAHILLMGKWMRQSRSQRPRSLWLVTGIAPSGQVQLWKSVIYGLPVTLRMLRVKSGKSDWFWSQSIVFTQPFKPRMSLGSGPDISSAWQKGPLGTRLWMR